MKKQTVKKPNFFDYVRQIDSKGTDLKFNSKYCPKYMLTLHYSQSDALIKSANEINKFLFSEFMTDKLVYDYFYHKIPKGKRFIKWAKKDKETVSEELKQYCEINDCSLREAKLMIKEVK